MIDHTDMGDLPAGTPEVLHYLHDVLGSVVALTNSNGAVVERHDYDPYGATYILDPAGVPLAMLPVDPWAADGYFHDHDQDGDLDAADYADLVACANDTPYDPMCIYSLDRNGDRRVDHVDVGAYLAHADSNGLVGPPAGMANYGRPLRLGFDADGDGRIDLFDWYALQTCYDRVTTRCNHLFDADASAGIDGPDLDAFRASAEPPYSGPPSKPWRRQLVASRYGNPFMWTGQRYDATTGQYHFWARTYSPRLGRWLQRDPLGYLDGVGLYNYVSDRPTCYFDPLGLWYYPPNPFEEYRWGSREDLTISFEVWNLIDDAMDLVEHYGERAAALLVAAASRLRMDILSRDIGRLFVDRAILIELLSRSKFLLSEVDKHVILRKINRTSEWINVLEKKLAGELRLHPWLRGFTGILTVLLIYDAWSIGRDIGDPIGRRLDRWFRDVGLWEDYLDRLSLFFGISLPWSPPTSTKCPDLGDVRSDGTFGCECF